VLLGASAAATQDRAFTFKKSNPQNKKKEKKKPFEHKIPDRSTTHDVRIHAALLLHKFKYQQRATHNFLLLLLLNSSRSKELDFGIYFHQKTGRSRFFHHAI